MFRKPTVEQRIADAKARNAAKDFVIGMFCMLCLMIAMTAHAGQPQPQPEKKKDKDFLDYATELVGGLL